MAIGAACVFHCKVEAARADDKRDATYGRVEGDLSLVTGIGAAVTAAGPRGVADLRLRYLEVAGLFATYEQDFCCSSKRLDPLVAAGLELRPLFLLRWLRGYEAQPRGRIDLAIDSIGLELGTFFARSDGGALGEKRGLEIGFGIEAPVFVQASGLWLGLYGGLRWSENAMAFASVRSAEDREAYIAITLAWHQLMLAHVVDLGDEPVR